jgi:hypothetical protein
MDPVRVLAFGGCTLGGPFDALAARDRRFLRAPLSTGGETPGIFSFGEIFQLLAVYRGEIDPPPEIRPLIGMEPEFQPVPGAGSLDVVDAVLVEPSSAYELKFRGYSINRSAVTNLVYDPLRHADPELYKLVYHWYEKGLVAGNHDVRQDRAEKLIARLPERLPNPELAAAVLRELVSYPTDVPAAMQRLRQEITKPIGVLVYTFRYMADGRPVSWPREFIDTVVKSAEQLGLPMLEPWRVVQAHGVRVAMQEDLRHYREDFLPAMGIPIGDFAHRVAGEAEPDRRLVTPATPTPTWATEAAKCVDSVLIPLHGRRVAELGIDDSGLYDHYKLLLDRGQFATPAVTGLVETIAQSLPRFAVYHVLRAGLGELAFTLGATRRKVVACESEALRFRALQAGLEALGAKVPDVASFVSSSPEAIPQVSPENANDVLCVAVHLMGYYRQDEQERALEQLSRYSALLIQPRTFLKLRDDPQEQKDAVDALRSRGFTVLRQLPQDLLYCAKPGSAPLAG